MHPLGLVLLGIVAVVGMLWVKSQPVKQQRAAVIKVVTTLVIMALVYLAVTGKLHWLGVLIAAVLPFMRKLLPLIIRFLPFLKHLYDQRQAGQHSNGNHSEVQTAIIKMTLDHDSGVMYGTVLNGPLQGRELGNLSEQEFIQLLTYCRQHDAESARLLEAYLDKRFGDSWREDDPGHQHHQNHASDSGPMSRDEAYNILGLKPDADEKSIIEAHRRLMQKVHPDRGGSDYLAAKINQAKDLLLNGE
ncbi:DnaJ domain-containing protein [Pontibacterium granulatum]|uniref:DnaJ domain-containing protein n=1 Tax=Pontibacterium granulatum TaxID=2036029 RepID=UPI00249A0C90|nr:DnaJ domain-containing protein [Pontibacterium granulatum]MDI3325613.1 DnaJ domain-containing protein [Pontibacterium granulatum]